MLLPVHFENVCELIPEPTRDELLGLDGRLWSRLFVRPSRDCTHGNVYGSQDGFHFGKREADFRRQPDKRLRSRH